MNATLVRDTIFKHGLACGFVGMLLLFVLLHFTLPQITSRSIQRLPDEASNAVLFPHAMPDFWDPWHEPDNMPSAYLYSITLDYQPYQQTHFALYPTGCVQHIQINGADVSVDGKANCNRDLGFTLDLAPYLHPGSNEIKITLDNHKIFRGSYPMDTATYGLQFAPLMVAGADSSLSTIIVYLLVACTCVTLTILLRYFTGELLGGLILSGGLLVYLLQLQATSYMQYVIDMPSHFHYICFIANHGFTPNPLDGWEYYQPPLYYWIEAQIMCFCNWLGSFDAITLMRLFSVVCFMVFLLFSALMLKRLISNRLAYATALVLLVFYPTGILYASRLDSHVLLYSFYSGCTYFLMRWIYEGRIRYCWLALACFGIAIGTRSNALILVPLIAAAGIYQFYNKRFFLRDLRSPIMLASVCIVVMGLMMNFGRTAYFHTEDQYAIPYIVGNVYAIAQSHHVTTQADHLFLLNSQQLFNPPFIDWRDDQTGRQYFWNTVLKTSLFEHFAWNSVKLEKLLLALLLAAISYMVFSSLWIKVDKRKEWYLCSLTLALALSMLMLNRVIHPYAPSQHFRYIYPALVSFCGIMGLIIEQYFSRERYVGAFVGMVIVLLFSCSAVWMIQAG